MLEVIRCKGVKENYTNDERLKKLWEVYFMSDEELVIEDIIYILEYGLSYDNRIIINDGVIIVIDEVNRRIYSNIEGSLSDLIEGILSSIDY